MSSVTMPAQGFVPRFYQMPLWKFIQRGGRRAVTVLPRRHGKDISCLNLMACQSLTRVGLYTYVFPLQNQARRVVWNGIDREGKRFLDAWPKELIANKSTSEMRLHLKNGSVIQIMGSDDPDKLVGMNPIGVVFSEFAMCDPMSWKLISPILAENGGWVIFNSTPRGRNHFYKLLNHAQANPADIENPKPGRWYWQHETALTLKVLTPDELREMRDELNDEALFQQEAMCSFTSPMQGSYYDRQIRYLHKNKRLMLVPAEPALPVYTGWDIGVGDSTAIWCAQVFGKEVRMVHYLENSGEGLPFYIRRLKEWAAPLNLTWAEHLAPHDIKVREFSSGKSRVETARELGFRFRPVAKHSLEDGIEAVRNFLPRCWFDVEACDRGIDALTGYRKEWDSARACFRNHPVHDWCSHGADAFRTLVWGLKKNASEKKKAQPQQYSDAEYSPFS